MTLYDPVYAGNKSATSLSAEVMRMSAAVAVAHLADLRVSGKIPNTKELVVRTTDMTAVQTANMMMVTRPGTELVTTSPTELVPVACPREMLATSWTDFFCPNSWRSKAPLVRLASLLTF